MLLARLPLPKDIIDTEIKPYVFYDNLSSESRKKKQLMTEKFKTNIHATRTRGFGQNNEMDPHWAIGFIDDENERLQLQANSCERCGNYLLFGSMLHYTPTQLANIICSCVPENQNPVEIVWDDAMDLDLDLDYESDATQETIVEHYDDDEEYV